MAQSGFEKLRVYQLSEDLADGVWEMVLGWNSFARNTVGEQIVCAADSIGANIAEGTGRESVPDNRRFVRIARGSLRETQHFLRRAYRRKLMKESQVVKFQALIAELAPKLTAYLNSIGRAKSSATNNQQPTTYGMQPSTDN